VDFPHHKPQSAQQQELNQRLAQTLSIQGFPTIVILDQNGRAVGRLGYRPGGPKPFIAELQKIPGLIPGAPRVVTPNVLQQDPPRKPVIFVPIAPSTPTRYNELALKAISGVKGSRMALINNENFKVGDIANVKFQDKHIEVCCKEIREDSVLITADGKTMELKLGKR
jgi:hypothetical protein